MSAAINKQEENVANKKSKIVKIVAHDLGYEVPQSAPLLFSSSSSSASTAAPSSSAGAASSSSTVQNMIVDRRDGVKRDNDSKDDSRDNDENSSKTNKLPRKTTNGKGADSSFTKKEKALLALTNAEQSMDTPKSIF